jgi:hypothetical protein
MLAEPTGPAALAEGLGVGYQLSYNGGTGAIVTKLMSLVKAPLWVSLLYTIPN